MASPERSASEGITTMASTGERKSTKRDDLDRWLGAEYQADPGMEQRVETLMREMEIDMGLTALRKASGLSQNELAKRIGVTQPAVAKIESGRVKNLELKTLLKYVAALGGRVKIEILPGRSGGRRSPHAVK